MTVGTFDGVHRGHLDVISRLVASATNEGLHSVALTCEPHPLDVVNPAARRPGTPRAAALLSGAPRP